MRRWKLEVGLAVSDLGSWHARRSGTTFRPLGTRSRNSGQFVQFCQAVA